MKALEAAAIQALHSGQPSSLCSLLPTILGLQQFCSGTDKYPRDPGSHQLPPHLQDPPQTNRYIIICTHTHARGHGHTDRTGRKGGGAGQGDPTGSHPRALSRRAAPTAPLQRSLPAPAPRVPGKARPGCSPAAPRPGIQLDVAVMGLSSSRSRLELPGWRLL